tara:strand:+ start:658 stop:1224 length:567 start_codon:yes stop_codon:yes gene_type:complete
MKKRIGKIVFLFILISIIILFSKNHETDQTIIDSEPPKENLTYNANILKDVIYTSKDAKGNEYVIKASEGEIDFSDNNIIYLTNVSAFIKLNNSETVEIYSDFGKYNTVNFDTIFSQNVIVNYLVNKITGEYLDFSLERNSMIISRDVVYRNLENILKADVIEIDIKTKDTKIFMYEKNEKVKVKSKN